MKNYSIHLSQVSFSRVIEIALTRNDRLRKTATSAAGCLTRVIAVSLVPAVASLAAGAFTDDERVRPDGSWQLLERAPMMSVFGSDLAATFIDFVGPSTPSTR